MTAALRYEWMRIRTIRSTWWLSGITVIFGTGLSFLIALGLSQSFDIGPPPPRGDVLRMGPLVVGEASGEGAPFFVPYILAMVGVFAWGHEYRHGMIRATLTALPSRANAWAAKFVVVALWVAVVTLVTLLLGALMGWLWLHDDGVRFMTYDVWRTVAKAVVYSVLFTLAATAFTAIIRQQAAALVLMFLWPLAIEQILGLVPRLVPGLEEVAGLARFLPFDAGARILGGADVGGAMFGDPLTPWAGFVVFGGFAAVLMAVSIVLFQKRDA